MVHDTGGDWPEQRVGDPGVRTLPGHDEVGLLLGCDLGDGTALSFPHEARRARHAERG